MPLVLIPVPCRLNNTEINDCVHCRCCPVAATQSHAKIMALVTNLSVSRPVALALSSDSDEVSSQITPMNVPFYFLY